jgi:hypothetical protein
MLTWLLRLEDPRHLWTKQEGSPVIMRLRLPENLTDLQMRHLCLADCSLPMQVDVEIGAWRAGAFDAVLSEIHCPVRPEPSSAKRRAPRTMNTACARHP